MKYLVRFNENMALAKSIISKKMEAFDKLKELLKSNIGYIGKFTEYLMNENIPFAELEALYKDLIDLKNKQKPVDISKLEYEEVLDKITINKNDLSVNSLISQFPSEQKNLARELVKEKEGFNLLLKASISDRLETLLTKISRYHSKSELKTALTLFAKDAMNDRDKIKEFLQGTKSSVVYESDDVMVVKVNSLSDIQKLGSDTSWCILGESMWTRYTSGRYQYIIYDFTKDDWNPKFKIGFTLNKDYTVHAAHDILDSGCSSYLNGLVSQHNIKYSELMPKSETIEVTGDMIQNLRKSSTVALLTQYSDNLPKELIPVFIKKLFDISVDARAIRTFSGGVVLGQSKIEIVKTCLNKYFSDKDVVTYDDLAKIDERLAKSISGLQSRDRGILKKKVATKCTLNSYELDPGVIVKMLDVWNLNDLVTQFAQSNLPIMSVPGSSMFGGVGFRWNDTWDKELAVQVSDKLNQIYDSGEWREVPIILNNKNYERYFIKNYIILNYALDRKEVVKKALDQLTEDDKLSNAYLLKMPIDLDKCQYSIRITEFNVPFIIKKDYSKVINIDKCKPSVMLIEHLMGYKINFKIAKTGFSRIVDTSQIPESTSKDILFNTLRKFSVRKRVGDVVKSDDGNITITLY